MAQEAPGHDSRVSKVGIPIDVVQDALGQDGQLSRAQVLLDVAQDAPDDFARGGSDWQAEMRWEQGTGTAGHRYVPRGRGVPLRCAERMRRAVLLSQ